MSVVRVVLPTHLQTLAQSGREVQIEVGAVPCQRSVIDALERHFPTLRGTIRDPATQKRRPYVRFFACEDDLSHEDPELPLPDAVANGVEPFFVVGAMAGG